MIYPPTLYIGISGAFLQVSTQDCGQTGEYDGEALADGLRPDAHVLGDFLLRVALCPEVKNEAIPRPQPGDCSLKIDV